MAARNGLKLMLNPTREQGNDAAVKDDWEVWIDEKGMSENDDSSVQ
jgi:hypothetical protein